MNIENKLIKNEFIESENKLYEIIMVSGTKNIEKKFLKDITNDNWWIINIHKISEDDIGIIRIVDNYKENIKMLTRDIENEDNIIYMKNLIKKIDRIKKLIKINLKK